MTFWTVWIRQNVISLKIRVPLKWSNFNKVMPQLTFWKFLELVQHIWKYTNQHCFRPSFSLETNLQYQQGIYIRVIKYSFSCFIGCLEHTLMNSIPIWAWNWVHIFAWPECYHDEGITYFHRPQLDSGSRTSTVLLIYLLHFCLLNC